jgi:electron-transferring-flavoprotein dehydrogenase
MSAAEVERQTIEADIVCVGFGPATAGFLTTLAQHILHPDGTPALESPSMPGLPLQVLCYERTDEVGFGVSGVVTKARGIRAAFPGLDPATIPLATRVASEKLVYLLDPVGASNRSPGLRLADGLLRSAGLAKESAYELPYLPPFLRKDGGLVLSLGQFIEWAAARLLSSGAVQIWPGTPVAEPLIENERVTGVRLVDQGTDRDGRPASGFVPGMDIRAALTVVADGPVGAVGRCLDEHFGLPARRHQYEWALGAKMVIDLPPETDLPPGAVFHTFGYPEPEIFGFFYVHPDRMASAGIFIPSWFHNPLRTSYRYLQHFVLHPYLWRYLAGGRMRSWGAKSILESGRGGEPFLAGDGYARIGEGSGSTNALTGSGVDEAWTTGMQLAEGVVELLKSGRPFTRQNLESAYVARRRDSWVETEGRIAEKARDGFHRGVIPGILGMALAGLTKGRHWIHGTPRLMPTVEEYYRDRMPAEEVRRIQSECHERGTAAHDALMERAGWPPIPYDGQLLVTQQDALLLGGKVQAAPGYADHVRLLYPDFCERCAGKLCIEICSGQALTPGPRGIPAFDREKCVHCGACLWNCLQSLEEDPVRGNIAFQAGAGGLHSSQN